MGLQKLPIGARFPGHGKARAEQRHFLCNFPDARHDRGQIRREGQQDIHPAILICGLLIAQHGVAPEALPPDKLVAGKHAGRPDAPPL